MLIYKIRKNSKYSSGGRNPSWNSKGKSWRIHNLYRHLDFIDYIAEYEGTEVVIFSRMENEELILETMVEVIPMKTFLQNFYDWKAKKKKDKSELKQRLLEKEEKALLKKLKEKYEKGN